MMNKKNWMKTLSLLAVIGLLNACAAPETKPEEAAPTATPAEKPMETMAKPSSDTYLVVRGDSLWKISGKPDIYNNPYQWPMIYKANRDKIKDADLIYPGQELAITRGNSQDEIDAAVNHAKTRGAWSLGVVEETDKSYLGM